MDFLGLGAEMDLVTTVELAVGAGVILFAIYLGSSLGIFRKS
ncbi:MAG TPA: hypothetical protein PLZ55_14795 [bacterium]|nr:hypothetical protein [bacterium]HPO09941.1 hypothetical protein [bacterium]HQO34678.1 hypothetical protein [bacterium]HQP97712.1 hypothetical protein [bacterium]